MFELTTYRQLRFAAGEATRLRVAFAQGAARAQLGNPTEIAGDALQHVTGSSVGQVLQASCRTHCIPRTQLP